MKDTDFPEAIMAITMEKEFKKGEILLRNGDFPEIAYFVLKGCLRSFIIDHKGKEHILQFAPEGWLISDHEGVVNKQLATLNIDAVEDSVVKIIKRNEAIKLSDLGKDTLIDMNRKFEKRIFTLQKRIIQLLSAPAEERYNDFNVMYPDLANRVPQKMIASYLGITPESLSRVRKECVSKK